MNRKIFFLGVLLLLGGIFSVDLALSEGPKSWAVSQESVWGTPIANFVFWIGLAHAGTFFSAILLVLGVNWQRRVALIAELSTLASLCVAGIFPLLHLGVPLRFHEMVPIGNLRRLFANVESPLVWDFVAILAYATLSTLYLSLHLLAERHSSLERFRKPFAWMLFPLVLWVHTIVSLDFAVTFVPEWLGGYFPLYFVLGALYSGVALVLLLLSLFGKRIRHVEEILLAFSWAMLGFWVWETIVKEVWNPEVVVFGFLLPQLLWISAVRERLVARVGVSVSILGALWWERLSLVQPRMLEWTAVDWGFFPFGIGVFCIVFSLSSLVAQRLLRKWRVAESPEMPLEGKFAAKPFVISLLLGSFSAVCLAVYFIRNAPAFPFVRIVPLLLPVTVLVAGILLATFAACETWGKRRTLPLAFGFLVVALGAFGWIYRGRETSFVEPKTVVRDEKPFDALSPGGAAGLWNARCAVCHGKDGSFNRKFVHEFYPLPQRLSSLRLDSVGEDSLARVILWGRRYMPPFAGRVSEDEAKSLVIYLKSLAAEKESRKR